jgi:hypothetical protein
MECNVADQNRSAAEIKTLTEGAVMIEMMSDFAILRDQLRICQTELIGNQPRA